MYKVIHFFDNRFIDMNGQREKALAWLNTLGESIQVISINEDAGYGLVTIWYKEAKP